VLRFSITSSKEYQEDAFWEISLVCLPQCSF